MHNPTYILQAQLLQKPIHDLLHSFDSLSFCFNNIERVLNEMSPIETGLRSADNGKKSLTRMQMNLRYMRNVIFLESSKIFSVNILVENAIKFVESNNQYNVALNLIIHNKHSIFSRRDSLPLTYIVLWIIYYFINNSQIRDGLIISLEVTNTINSVEIRIYYPASSNKSKIDSYLKNKQPEKYNYLSDKLSDPYALGFWAIEHILTNVYDGNIVHDMTNGFLTLTLTTN